MFNPVVGTGTASSFFGVGTMVALSIYVPIYFEAVVGLSAGQSGFALIALMGGTVAGAQIAGRVMAWSEHYKRGPTVGLAVAIASTALLAVTAGSLPLWQFEVLLALSGLGLGTIFPVTTVAIQNAVEPHQLGTATASFNFFRSLGSAILVAVFGAIFLGGLGFGGRPIGSLDRSGRRGGAERNPDRAGVRRPLRRGGGDACGGVCVLPRHGGEAAEGARRGSGLDDQPVRRQREERRQRSAVDIERNRSIASGKRPAA